MASKQDVVNNFMDKALWKYGPKPGSFYNFPSSSTDSHTGISKRTLNPTTTGTSVLGLAYKGGVVIAADTLGSYGSLARFRDCSRVMKVNDFTILGCGGDYADFQYLKNVIEQKVIDEECLYDEFTIKPRALHSWITRVLYNRRSQFDPFWTTFIVGGVQDGEPFLGHADKLGTAFECSHIATGYGAYIALPMLRKALEENEKTGKELNQRQAIGILVNCLRVLYYRDARSFYRYEFAIASKDGTKIEGPHQIDSNWDIAHYQGGTL
uniref:Proteasome subunit beta n=1 Tax=Strigamia maritima TaxID=126957 RepID=T1JMI3_STRMM